MLSGPSNLILEIEGKNSLLAFLALGSAMTDGRWLSTRGRLRNSSDGIQSQGSHKKSHAQCIYRIKNPDQTFYIAVTINFLHSFHFCRLTSPLLHYHCHYFILWKTPCFFTWSLRCLPLFFQGISTRSSSLRCFYLASCCSQNKFSSIALILEYPRQKRLSLSDQRPKRAKQKFEQGKRHREATNAKVETLHLQRLTRMRLSPQKLQDPSWPLSLAACPAMALNFFEFHFNI